MVNDELFKISKGKSLYSEEDVKLKVILPLLRDKGYDTEEDIRYENPIPVQLGSKKTVVESDIEIMIDGKTALVIDTKNPRKTLQPKDLLQASSYGKLVSTPPALYSFATNGYDLLGMDNIRGNDIDTIPTKGQLIADTQHLVPRKLTEIELHEVKSTLLTILNIDDLYNVIKKSKKIIENRALIRSDQSFKEMTKIILVKMNEEKRARDENKQNRFNSEYLQDAAKSIRQRNFRFLRTCLERRHESTKEYIVKMIQGY